jgi:DNA-binding transcriptional LysR family regulator
MSTSSAWDAAIDLRHLRYFIAIADTGSFSAAAKLLRCAQPAIGRQARQLEDRIGVKLFRRRSDGAELTELGKLFYPKALGLLSDLDKAISFVKQESGVLPQDFHVGFALSPTAELRPVVFGALKSKFPLLRIVPHEEAVEVCVEKVASGEMDCALNVAPLKRRLRSIRFEPLVNYDLLCAVSDTHPHANDACMSITQLNDEQLLVFSRHHMPQYMDDLRRIFRGTRFTPRIVKEYGGVTEILVGVCGGDGVALLLESAQEISTTGVKWLPLKPTVDKTPVGVIYKFPPSEQLKEVLNCWKSATGHLRKGSFSARLIQKKNRRVD